jgi:hypothetical protein
MANKKATANTTTKTKATTTATATTTKAGQEENCIPIHRDGTAMDGAPGRCDRMERAGKNKGQRQKQIPAG